MFQKNIFMLNRIYRRSADCAGMLETQGIGRHEKAVWNLEKTDARFQSR